MKYTFSLILLLLGVMVKAVDHPMEVRYFGATCVMISDESTCLLIDPNFTRPSLFKMVFTKIGTDQQKVDEALQGKKVDAVLISHSHFDHCLDARYVSEKFNAPIYGSPSAIVGMDTHTNDRVGRTLTHYNHTFQIGHFQVKAISSLHSPVNFFNRKMQGLITRQLNTKENKKEYKEGGTFEFLITHVPSGKQIYFIGSVNNVQENLPDVKDVDVLIWSAALLSDQSDDYQKVYLDRTLEALQPEKIIMVHWDKFWKRPKKKERKLRTLGCSKDYGIAKMEVKGVKDKLVDLDFGNGLEF